MNGGNKKQGKKYKKPGNESFPVLHRKKKYVHKKKGVKKESVESKTFHVTY
jgi:hypothetical protein